jgi:uncharacterized RDD family membrane protein YckC
VVAYGLDLSIRIIILIIFSIICAFFGKVGMGVLLIATFLIEWFYPVLFEVLRNGQTPGKRSMGLRVVNDNLTPVGWGPSITRNLLRTADFFPLLYLGGLVTCILSPRFQRLGDMAAGTLVIHHRKVLATGELPKVLPISPAIPLTLEDQVALVSYAQRHSQLTDARKLELAEIIPELSEHQAIVEVPRLQGMGLWLLGNRS